MRSQIFLGVVSVLAVTLLSGPASGATRFGARLTSQTQPSNAGNGVLCRNNKPSAMCSWVLMDAYQREAGGANGHLAPMDGTISKVRLIACAPGSFVLQIGRADPTTDQAMVLQTGPLINYAGDPRHCRGQRYQIETFDVNVPVSQGDYLAVVAPKVGFVRCSSGGDNTLLFDPPLADGGELRTATEGEGCWLLLEAEYAE
jgi:hypothetical protein